MVFWGSKWFGLTLRDGLMCVCMCVMCLRRGCVCVVVDGDLVFLASHAMGSWAISDVASLWFTLDLMHVGQESWVQSG